MRSIKNIIALLIALSLVCGVFVFAEEADLAADEISYTDKELVAFDFLQKIGIASLEDVLSDAVTRGKYASLMLKAVNMQISETEGSDGNVIFYDVPKSHEYFDEISKIYELGIASGYGGGVFKPDEKVNSDEAIVMLLNAMGYNSLADYYGPYIGNYYMLAKKSGIKSFADKRADEMRLIDAYVLLYEGLSAKACDKNNFSSEGTYGISNTETLLSMYFDIYKTEGKINSNTVTALRGYEKDSRFIYAGAERINVSGSEADKYLGYIADVYYRGENEKELVFIEPDDKAKIITIDYSDYSGFSEGRIEYYRNRKLHNVKLSSVMNVVYNGVNLKSFDKNIFDIDTGSVRLLSADGDEEYETVFIDTYINYTVKQINTIGNKIRFVNYHTDELDLEVTASEEVKTEFYHSDGRVLEKSDLAGISPNFTVSVFPEKFTAVQGVRQVDTASEYIKFIISEESADGTLKKISQSGDRTKLYVEDGEYLLSAANRFKKGIPPMGTVGSFLVDFNGEISDMIDESKESFSGFKFGYLINMSEPEGIGESIEMKILTEQGEVKIFKAGEKLKLNGTKVSSLAGLKATMINFAKNVNPSTIYPSQLIQFKQNKDDVVLEVRTVMSSVPGYVHEGDKDHIRLDIVREELRCQ